MTERKRYPAKFFECMKDEQKKRGKKGFTSKTDLKKAVKKCNLKIKKPAKKTIFVLQGTYGHGWEDLTAEETRAEIRQRLKEYRENEGGNYRIIRRRE